MNYHLYALHNTLPLWDLRPLLGKSKLSPNAVKLYLHDVTILCVADIVWEWPSCVAAPLQSSDVLCLSSWLSVSFPNRDFSSPYRIFYKKEKGNHNTLQFLDSLAVNRTLASELHPPVERCRMDRAGPAVFWVSAVARTSTLGLV